MNEDGAPRPRRNDARDWVVMAIVTAEWAAATAFLFKHPDAQNFVTWSAVCTTMVALYHFLCIIDDKRADAL